MRKNLVVAVLALIGLSGLAVLGSSPTLVENLLQTVRDNPVARIFSPKTDSDTENSSSDSKAVPERPKRSETSSFGQPDIPDEVLYDTVFRMDVDVRAQAQQQEGNGEIPTAFEYYFKNEAGLTDPEDEILRQVAKEFVDEIKSVDDGARTVIDSKSKMTQKKGALSLLQAQRDSIVLSNRDKLSSRLGPSSFAQLNQYIKGAFALKLKAYQPPTN